MTSLWLFSLIIRIRLHILLVGWQCDIQIAYGSLWKAFCGFWLSQEGEAPTWFLAHVSDLYVERKSVFLEGEEVKYQLLPAFGKRGKIAITIHVDRFALKNLNIFAAGHLLKVLLLLEGLVHFVVRHAEAAQPSLNSIIHLGEHHKFGQVRHADQLPV